MSFLFANHLSNNYELELRFMYLNLIKFREKSRARFRENKILRF